MQLSVDQKIQAAIQPLLERITALEAENEKFKQEIATLHAATQPKTAHKPAPKPPAEPVERPQTVKGGRKKSVQNHEVKPDTKTDKKPVIKKQEPKGQGEEQKPENPKPTGNKTPVINNKGVGSPNLNKDHNPVPKDTKAKPTTGTGNRASTTNINNKSIVGDKKPTTKSIQHHEQKKEGEQHHDEKKEHGSHQKPEHGKPTTTTSVHNPKTPPVTKTKGPEVKKPAVTGQATAGGAAKKGGKAPVTDTKKKPTDAKTDSPKEEAKEHKQETKQEHKEEEAKQEHKQPELTDEVKQEHKEEEAPQQHQATEHVEHVEEAEKEKEEVHEGEHENKQHPAEEEAI